MQISTWTRQQRVLPKILQLKKISGVRGADLPKAQLAEDFVKQKGTIDQSSSQALIDAVRTRNAKRK